MEKTRELQAAVDIEEEEIEKWWAKKDSIGVGGLHAGQPRGFWLKYVEAGLRVKNWKW